MTASELAALRHRTRQALDELAEIRESDPAAGSAMHAVRLAERTLADIWTPALEMSNDPPDDADAA